jgi:hypothetical protein
VEYNDALHVDEAWKLGDDVETSTAFATGVWRRLRLLKRLGRRQGWCHVVYGQCQESVSSNRSLLNRLEQTTCIRVWEDSLQSIVSQLRYKRSGRGSKVKRQGCQVLRDPSVKGLS